MSGFKRFVHGWLIAALVAALSAGIVPAIALAALPAAPAMPQHVTLTWAGDPRTTQTIAWKTPVPCAGGQVQYAEAAAGGGLPGNAAMVTAQAEPLLTEGGNMMLHTATLTGLKPGTRYLYRVGGGSGWSEPRSFTTAAEKTSGFKFLVFGDTQSDRYDAWRAVLRQAFAANPDAAFLTVVGDLVEAGQDYDQWDAWFNAAHEVLGVIPVMPLTGNHENYTPLWGERSPPTLFIAQFRLPGNGPAGLKGQVYSFDYGEVHFVMLDSQAREEARFVPDMLERQKAWLEKDLAATDKKWKVVFFHKPPYHSKAVRGNDDVRTAFVPVLDRYHADVVFNGHEHVYARTYPLRDSAVAYEPAAGTVYVTTGRAGAKVHGNMHANDWHEVYYNPEDEPNYLVVKVTNRRLAVEVYKLSGALIDSWQIEKGQ